jgi:peptidoglycan hydrolase-like protein with peptidoglycan-binding domain
VMEIALGYIEPLESATSARDRLIALGYLRIDEDTPEQFTAAVLEFQRQSELESTGELDDDTLDALEKEIG